MNRRAADLKLHNGLTEHERVVLLESAIHGDRRRPGLVERVQELEHAQRQRELGWFARVLRWLPFVRSGI